MTQKMKAEIVINIPETHVLIEKTELEELKERAEPEWVAGLDWLKNQTGMGSDTLKEKVLYPHKKDLVNFVDYPKEGQRLWRFNTHEMKAWLRNNFARVMK